ncbi:DUF2784 domain-containing protein [Methylosarcina fibrata]|uniref:DUF2784 domain-containing protein n=1 Tax=Methylosarcina fibrata TaxID=105972 RepID=UPI000368258A|nr:DUF2784 domain-containing protein [Methylosarcina fibrata]
MWRLILADLVVAIHFSFILFVVLGGLLALKWRRIVWLHLPAAVWGALIEFAGWICPLTFIENRLRTGHGSGYSSSFIEHYLIPVIYPSALTREIQIGLGLTVVLINVLIYRQYYIKWLKRQP